MRMESPETYPQGGSFADLLNWHLDFGTRPQGSPDRPGRRWNSKEFGAALGGTNDRAVRNWRTGRNLPVHLDIIERALFGDSDTYDQWRIDLRVAYDGRRQPLLTPEAPQVPRSEVLFDKERLRQARHDAGLTHQTLAVRAGVSEVTIRLAEVGNAIGLKTAQAIAAALDTQVEQLLLPFPPATDPIPTQGAGPHLSISATGRITQAPPTEIDAKGNYVPRIQQLLPLVRLAADDLAAWLNPKDNAFSELARDLQRYREAIAGAGLDLPWGLIWGLGVRLEEAAAAAERAIIDRTAPSLEDAALAALQSLRTLHAPLIMATAEGRELQEQADRLRMTRTEQEALHKDAVTLSIELQRSEDIIEPKAAAIVVEASDTIGKGRHPERGTVFGIATIRHLSIVLIGAAVIVTPSQIVGGVVGAGITMGAWEAIKKSPIYAAATAALGDEFNRLIKSGGAAARERLTRLAPFRSFVQANELHLRRIATDTPQLNWTLRYIDYIVQTNES